MQEGYLDVDESPSVGGTEVLDAAQGEHPAAFRAGPGDPGPGKSSSSPWCPAGFIARKLLLLQRACGQPGAALSLPSVQSSTASRSCRAEKHTPESGISHFICDTKAELFGGEQQRRRNISQMCRKILCVHDSF